LQRHNTRSTSPRVFGTRSFVAPQHRHPPPPMAVPATPIEAEVAVAAVPATHRCAISDARLPVYLIPKVAGASKALAPPPSALATTEVTLMPQEHVWPAKPCPMMFPSAPAPARAHACPRRLGPIIPPNAPTTAPVAPPIKAPRTQLPPFADAASPPPSAPITKPAPAPGSPNSPVGSTNEIGFPPTYA